jgi:hypothetical protein
VLNKSFKIIWSSLQHLKEENLTYLFVFAFSHPKPNRNMLCLHLYMDKNMLTDFQKQTYRCEVISRAVVHQGVEEAPDSCTVTASHGVDVLFNRVTIKTGVPLLVDNTLIVLVLGVQNATIPRESCTTFIIV